MRDLGGHRIYPLDDCEADDGDPIGMRVSLPIELLAKDVGVDFLINELQAMELQHWADRASKKGSTPPIIGVPV